MWAGLTGWTPRTLDVDLSLLDPGREYAATLLADDGRSVAEPARYALHATGDLRDTAANTRGARRRFALKDRTG